MQPTATRRTASTPPVRVLLDECLPERVVDVLDRMRPEHEFEHVRTLGWAGATNGELQADARDEGFEAMVTGDVNMEFQTPRPPMPVVVIPTNRSFGDVSRYLVEVAEKLDQFVRWLPQDHAARGNLRVAQTAVGDPAGAQESARDDELQSPW